MQNVILKFDEYPDGSRVNELEQWLHRDGAAGSVDRCEKRDHLLLVEYDQERFGRPQILQHLSEQGLHARVTGC